jgi:hypothetical protein
MREGFLFRNAVLVLAAVATCFPCLVRAASAGVTGSANISVEVREFEIIEVDGGQRVRAEGFGVIGESGRPDLPGKIFALAVPPGAQVVSVTVEPSAVVTLDGSYQILPTPLRRVLGDEDPQVAAAWLDEWQQIRAATYSSDQPYPEEPASLVGEGSYRRYRLVEVRVAPFRYQPTSGALEYYPELAIRVDYELPEVTVGQQIDFVPRLELRAQEIVANYEQAQSWYAQDSTTSEQGIHDLVIITTDALVDAVSPLVDHETLKGRSPEVVTVETIEATTSAPDRAAAIRTFLRTVYLSSAWGIEDVLLVGAPAQVPMRECCIDLGYGRPRTDFYFAELSESDADSWDSDGDGCYGEETDDQIDLYSEVNVGRIPWSNPVVVERICRKSAAYERNDDPAYKRNILVMGAYFWADTDTAHLMEVKLDQSWMADWTITRLYEQNAEYWSSFACDLPLDHGNSISTWSADTYGFVNWAGHGSPTSAHILGSSGQAFVQTSDCLLLDDEYPAIVWSDSCSTANPIYQNLAREMIGHGAVGFVGSTAVALGAPAWTDPWDGSSQSCDYWFTTEVTSGDMTQGEAHQFALLNNYINGLWSLPKYEIFEWTLHGSPTLGMAEVIFPEEIFIDDLETGDTLRWSEVTP